MWTQFTKRSRQAVIFAQEEAAGRGQSVVEAEHLLLGVLRDSDNLACKILKAIGVAPAEIYADVTALLPLKEQTVVSEQMYLNGRAKQSIDVAFAEAQELDHRYIGAEHLLLGLVQDERIAPLFLQRNATRDGLRGVVRRMGEGIAPFLRNTDSGARSE